MVIHNHYLIMEVLNKREVKSIEVFEDDFRMGYEPQSELELKNVCGFLSEKLVCTLSGKAALHPFKKGDIVAVMLCFRAFKKEEELVNQIFIEDIKLVKELDYLFL